MTNQAALRKANGKVLCRALLIAVKAPRQIQYRHGLYLWEYANSQRKRKKE